MKARSEEIANHPPLLSLRASVHFVPSCLLRHYPMAFFSKITDKLKGALRKTAQVLNTDVRTLFVPGRQINDAFLAELEEKFLQADMGVNNVEQDGRRNPRPLAAGPDQERRRRPRASSASRCWRSWRHRSIASCNLPRPGRR